MKILQINVVCGVKSTGRYTTDIAALAEERGYEAKVAYGREEVPAPLQKYAIKIGTPFSNKCHAVLSRAFSMAGFASKKATKKLIEQIKAYDPDVIHLHNLHGSYIHVGVLFDYLKSADKKVIWTLHDCWSFTGYCAHFVAEGCQKWQTGCHNCPQKRSYGTVWMDKSKRNYAWKKSTFTGVKDMTLVVPSNWLAGLVRQSFLKDYPVKVIHSGIDLTRFKPAESNLREKYSLQDKKIILGVATAWGKKKGLQDFYTLSQKLDDSYRVVLVGLTEKQIKDSPKEVLALPKTDSVDELTKWYSQADVFVNCTYEDTYPMVNIEAQVCGAPAITYATGGSVESVPEGHIVPQGDIDALIQKIPEVIASGAKVDLSFCDKQRAYQSYLRLYEGKE